MFFHFVKKIRVHFLKYNIRKETKMNKRIEDLLKKDMGNFMDRSRDELASADKIYLNDRRMKRNWKNGIKTWA